VPIRTDRRGERRLILAFALVLVAVWGCAREERGPLLVGGRELNSWLKDLHDPKAVVRRQAVLKLGNVGEADPAVAEGLASALGDPDATVRREAVFAVVKLKQPPASIIERLNLMGQNDRDTKVRDAAKRAAARLSGN
jgi:HEAT repeat protein